MSKRFFNRRIRKDKILTMLGRDVFKTLSNKKDRAFCKNN